MELSFSTTKLTQHKQDYFSRGYRFACTLLDDCTHGKSVTREAFELIYLNEKKKRDFFSWLKTQKIEFEPEEVEEHWDYIQNRILSNVASSIWGKEFLFKKLLEVDNQVQEALKHMDEARKLIDL